MTMKSLPKITRIPTGDSTIESDEFKLSNYQVATFLLETGVKGDTVAVTVKAFGDADAEETIPFAYKKNSDKIFTRATSEGVILTHEADDAEVYIIAISGDMLAHGGYDRVILNLEATSADTVTTLYAFQTQPRYSDLDE